MEQEQIKPNLGSQAKKAVILFSQKYKENLDILYIPNFAKDIKLFKILLKVITLQELENYIVFPLASYTW